MFKTVSFRKVAKFERKIHISMNLCQCLAVSRANTYHRGDKMILKMALNLKISGSGRTHA